VDTRDKKKAFLDKAPVMRLPHVPHEDYHIRMSEGSLEHCQRFLGSHRLGDLQFDQHVRSIKFVIASDGRLVAPVMVAMLQALETVLFVPRATLEDDDQVQLLVTLYQFDEHGPEGEWADGEAMILSNPLATFEPAICKHMNQQVDALRTLALHHAHLEIANPRLVGADPLGFDVRGQFDIARIHATRSPKDADDAIGHLDELLARVRDLPHPAEASPEANEMQDPDDA
jgi:hypothetical protein